MQWRKRVSPRAGRTGWADDFPLDSNLPGTLTLDLGELREPIHPMLIVRCRAFVAWHRGQDRTVEVILPKGEPARRIVQACQIDPDARCEPLPDIVLPVTELREFGDVEVVAERTMEILEYQLHDVSALGEATFMAVSELCNNAVEHGASAAGAYAAVRRFTEPRPQVCVAICDLGIGIPEHIRQRLPELSDDSHAIAVATEPGVSGTGHAHRGRGYEAVFDAALTNAMHEARFTILSARGYFENRISDGRHNPVIHPASQYRRGTWIACDLVSV